MTTNKAVIASFARTPIGKFRSSLSSFTAPELGSIAITAALHRLPVPVQLSTTNSAAPTNHEAAPVQIHEAYIGNVLSAGIGQAPARQAVLNAHLPVSTICTTVHKVCASGMKAATLAAQTCSLNTHRVVLAGGMESMSNVPFYVREMREGVTLGHAREPILDGIVQDGLWDVYHDQHMGMCAEKCAVDYSISRVEQDEYARESYRRALQAQAEGRFEFEIAPVKKKVKRGSSEVIEIVEDEEPGAARLDKMSTLKPAFLRNGDGTVTAANASSINDGAAAMVIMSEENARLLGIQPLARILSTGEAEQEPVDFTTTPSKAINDALLNAGMSINDVDYHEINEAFSVVSLANMKILDLDPTRVNIFGGAVSLGHPIGMSGARIIGTLYNVLKTKDASIGCASICNGGGGASAMIVERLD